MPPTDMNSVRMYRHRFDSVLPLRENGGPLSTTGEGSANEDDARLFGRI